MDTTATTVAFLGTGTMGEALLKGSLDGGLDTHDVWVTARSQKHVDDLVDTYGAHGTTDNAKAASNARIGDLAVPPRDVPGLIAEVANHLRDDAVVVSLADGIALADLEGHLRDEVVAARAMPSLTAQVGHGLTLLATGDTCTAEQAEAVTTFSPDPARSSTSRRTSTQPSVRSAAEAPPTSSTSPTP
jgi:pyrroline-5-carboxylate reductase